MMGLVSIASRSRARMLVRSPVIGVPPARVIVATGGTASAVGCESRAEEEETSTSIGPTSLLGTLKDLPTGDPMGAKEAAGLVASHVVEPDDVSRPASSWPRG